MEQELELLVDDKTKKLIFLCDAIDVTSLKQLPWIMILHLTLCS